MAETWLKTNTRAIWFGMVVPALLLVVGIVLASGVGREESSPALRAIGMGLGLVSLLVIGWLGGEIRRPRLAFEGGCLLVNLHHAGPVRVPIEIVECFFLGQSPSLLPGRKYETTETSAVVVRLAERAADWSHFDVKPALGKWRSGYITIRGTWCEPLDIKVVNELNRRLAVATGLLPKSGASA